MNKAEVIRLYHDADMMNDTSLMVKEEK